MENRHHIDTPRERIVIPRDICNLITRYMNEHTETIRQLSEIEKREEHIQELEQSLRHIHKRLSKCVVELRNGSRKIDNENAKIEWTYFQSSEPLTLDTNDADGIVNRIDDGLISVDSSATALRELSDFVYSVITEFSKTP